MASNDNDPPPVEAQGEDAPLGFEDAVEQQLDLDEENRRRFPQIPKLAFHPCEGIEQQQMGDEDEDEDEQEMNMLEDNLNHEQEQLNRLQEQIRHIQRHLLFHLNNREGADLEQMDDDDDHDLEEAEVMKILLTNQ